MRLFNFLKYLLSAGVLLILVLTAGISVKAENQNMRRLTANEFQVQFKLAGEKGDTHGMQELASKHRDLLRPFIYDLLKQYIKLASKDETKESLKLLNLAAVLAKLTITLSNDNFPLRQVERYRSWSTSQLTLKVKADSYAAEAVTAFNQGRYGDVIEPGKAAVKLYIELTDEAGQMDILHYLGQAGRRLAKYDEAVKWHEKALALAKSSNDRPGIGKALTDLGDVYERQKNRPEAIKSYKKALSIYKTPENWQEAGRTLRQLGDVYVAVGDFKSAYGSYSQALQYAEDANDTVLTAEYNDYMGYCFRQLGDFKKAILFHRMALKSAEQIGDGNLQGRAQARALNHIGFCMFKLAGAALTEKNHSNAVELYREAIKNEEQSLNAATKVHDRWREGYVLRILSLIHHDLGKILSAEKAQKEYLSSLNWANRAVELALSMKEKEWEGLSLHHKGLAQILLGRESEGLITFQKAQTIWETIGDLQSLSYSYRIIAKNIYEVHSRFKEALAAYDRMIMLSSKIGNIESEADALFGKAGIMGKTGKKDEAVRLYEEGLIKLEKVRTLTGFLEFKKTFMERVYEKYEEAATYMLENKFFRLAFKYTESMKARVFLDRLAEGMIDLEKGVDPELKKKQDELENKKIIINMQITDEYKKLPVNETKIALLIKEYKHLDMELESLRKQIKLKNPLYASVQYPEPVTVQELQQKILKKDETILEYFLSKERVYCFVISKNKYNAVKLAIKHDELEEEVENLLAPFKEIGISGKMLSFDTIKAFKLYESLIKPVEQHITSKTLIVIPDGILAKLPFEALIAKSKGSTKYFFEKYRIKYVQSASVLGILRTEYKKEGLSDKFIGFGDPVYDYENFKEGKPEQGSSIKGVKGGAYLIRNDYARAGGKLERLVGSGEEINDISKIFREKSVSYLRLDAKEEYAKSKNMEQYGYIHFSTHGILDSNFQAIALSQIPDTEEDGMLTLGEIMNSKYNAKLVVLSACQTGLGKIERGEGITGLTRAVMYAGAPAVVVSLWSVSDIGTKELMIRFYKNMIKKKKSKEDALRDAKLEMLTTEYSHPFFWSAFVMYGE